MMRSASGESERSPAEVHVKPGKESQTAVMVAAARAAAHGRTRVAAFSDPTALTLLPEDARRRVEEYVAGVPPKDSRARMQQRILRAA